MVAIPGKHRFEQNHRLHGRLNVLFLYPISTCIEMALADFTPLSIDIWFTDPNDPQNQHPPDTPSFETGTGTGLAKIYMSVAGPLFVDFYEAYKDWLYQTLKHPDNWPEIWRFGRIVRNALSHAQTIYFQRQEAPASWRGVTYSFSDQGRAIFDTQTGDLTAGDVFLLMIEMSEELDRLRCPA